MASGKDDLEYEDLLYSSESLQREIKSFLGKEAKGLDSHFDRWGDTEEELDEQDLEQIRS